MVMSEYELVLKVTNIVHLPGAIHLADFNTHVFGAAAFVSLGATSATKLLSLSLTEGITLMAAGLIGGILPDIDLPASTPSKALFTTLGVIAGLAWMFANLPDYTSLELWIGTITIALLSRFVLAGVFSRFTTHRGALHSLIAAFMWGLVACALSWQYFQASALQSWLTGGFLTVGYICHLALDEMYNGCSHSSRRSLLVCPTCCGTQPTSRTIWRLANNADTPMAFIKTGPECSASLMIRKLNRPAQDHALLEIAPSHLACLCQEYRQ